MVNVAVIELRIVFDRGNAPSAPHDDVLACLFLLLFHTFVWCTGMVMNSSLSATSAFGHRFQEIISRLVSIVHLIMSMIHLY
jgi:hypothetical protein